MLLGIGSGIYTAKQTRRVRETYGIPGSHHKDLVAGILCQPCSQIRNELEVRVREKDKHELAYGLRQPPVPLGENYRPLAHMPIVDPYQSPPSMRHIVPVPANHPSEGQEQLFQPRIDVLADRPNTASPSDRRLKMLTPVRESGELADDSKHGGNTSGAGTIPACYLQIAEYPANT